jgi:hypothetical protein
MYAEGCRMAGVGEDPWLCEAVAPFHQIVRATRRNGISGQECRRLILAVFGCRHHAASPLAKIALHKLRIVARTCLDFLENSPRPKIVATMRQANLVAICNARCSYCIGLYTSEIINGEEHQGRRYKRMNAAQVLDAFARPDNMTLFFMNGSEFLLSNCP